MTSVEPIFDSGAGVIVVRPQFAAAFFGLCHEVGHEDVDSF